MWMMIPSGVPGAQAKLLKHSLSLNMGPLKSQHTEFQTTTSLHRRRLTTIINLSSKTLSSHRLSKITILGLAFIT
jgi:hypothetical protein